MTLALITHSEHGCAQITITILLSGCAVSKTVFLNGMLQGKAVPALLSPRKQLCRAESYMVHRQHMYTIHARVHHTHDRESPIILARWCHTGSQFAVNSEFVLF